MKGKKRHYSLWVVIVLCFLSGVVVRFYNGMDDVPLGGFEAKLKVHFINVGQADSTLIQLPDGKCMLIDAGNNDNGEEIVAYIKQQGIDMIDYLIGTHPHADHIGGLDDVISAFDIGTFYMPKVQSNTKTFRDVLEAAQKKGLKIKTAKAGVKILNQDSLNIDILAPNQENYEDLNNYSAVVRLQFENNVFLFMGDAEQLSESEITQEVHADVLKVGHHGSKTSTSDSFLQRVSPKYAYISCGKDNSYGHPHKETLQKLKRAGVMVYRSDLDGTVIFNSDGDSMEVEK